jgi:hypothetical protein
LRRITTALKKIASAKVMFSDISEEVLNTFNDLTCSEQTCGESEYCIKTDNGDCQLIIPRKHLISGSDNETVYYGRIADELVRYNRIRLFMTQPKTYLNIVNTDYKINNDEFILLQTSINNDYLKGLEPFNTTSQIYNINYDNAAPQISQTYSNEVIPMAEQVTEGMRPNVNVGDILIECIKETVEIVGNPQESMWKRLFPKKAKEIVFKNTSTNCSFYVLLYAFQDRYNTEVSVQSIKLAIWNGYKEFYPRYKEKILEILKRQGKKDIVTKIRGNKNNLTQYSLESVIMSDEYYLTDLDIWAFAKNAKMQICLFSKNKLKGISETLEWLIMGTNYREKHYFIRSPVVIPNKPASYNLVMPTYTLGELGEFENIVQSAVSGRNKSLAENIQSFSSYLEKLVL